MILRLWDLDRFSEDNKTSESPKSRAKTLSEVLKPHEEIQKKNRKRKWQYCFTNHQQMKTREYMYILSNDNWALTWSKTNTHSVLGTIGVIHDLTLKKSLFAYISEPVFESLKVYIISRPLYFSVDIRLKFFLLQDDFTPIFPQFRHSVWQLMLAICRVNTHLKAKQQHVKENLICWFTFTLCRLYNIP